jgi:hypothetical protein
MTDQVCQSEHRCRTRQQKADACTYAMAECVYCLDVGIECVLNICTCTHLQMHPSCVLSDAHQIAFEVRVHDILGYIIGTLHCSCIASTATHGAKDALQLVDHA